VAEASLASQAAAERHANAPQSNPGSGHLGFLEFLGRGLQRGPVPSNDGPFRPFQLPSYYSLSSPYLAPLPPTNWVPGLYARAGAAHTAYTAFTRRQSCSSIAALPFSHPCLLLPSPFAGVVGLPSLPQLAGLSASQALRGLPWRARLGAGGCSKPYLGRIILAQASCRRSRSVSTRSTETTTYCPQITSA
jgi:hypothetical protein